MTFDELVEIASDAGMKRADEISWDHLGLEQGQKICTAAAVAAVLEAL